MSNTIEDFLIWLRNGGWDSIESYFYNSSEEDFIRVAIEKYQSKELKSNE